MTMGMMMMMLALQICHSIVNSNCYFILVGENRGSTVVKVLCYKSEGRWFHPSWCQWILQYVAASKGIVVAQWLRCCATNWKVAGSIPAGVTGIFH